MSFLFILKLFFYSNLFLINKIKFIKENINIRKIKKKKLNKKQNKGRIEGIEFNENLK